MPFSLFKKSSKKTKTLTVMGPSSFDQVVLDVMSVTGAEEDKIKKLIIEKYPDGNGLINIESVKYYKKIFPSLINLVMNS
tara:strand:- start:1045 stop:1284 length:240 start_codon:yes stop_codon:yes gene_type:complete